MVGPGGTDLAGRANGNRVALFIDVDNVLICSQNAGLPFHLSLIIDRVRQQGTIMSSKAYADWTSNLLRPFLGDFRANAIELVELLTSVSSREHKNTADIQLAVDALEMVFLPGRPDTMVIVGGDRDYVPLVQKLKRYGVFVMGLGVEAGVSPVLAEACDSFVYYDNIVPPDPEEVAKPESLPDLQDSFSLMARAVEALRRDGRSSTGISVLAMMKQLAPTFDLARYKTTFKAIAESAQQAGYVDLIENPGSDFTLTPGKASENLASSVTDATEREYDYSTTEAITASYRAILQDRRIPLIAWQTRQKFVQLIWDSLEERRDYGLSLDGMRRVLLERAHSDRLPVSMPMIQKLLYTLNLAHCFNTQSNANSGYAVQVPDEVHYPLFPVVDLEGAINAMHRNYLVILVRGDATLHPDAAYALLYGDEITDAEESEHRRQVLEKMCRDIRPMGSVGHALVEAGRHS